MSPATVTNQNEKLAREALPLSFLVFEHVFSVCFGHIRSKAPQGQGPSPRVRRPVRSAGPKGRQRQDKTNCLGSSLMSTSNENNQANRTISTGKLHALLHFHTRPINVVVFHGSQGNTRFQVGFPLRCLQRLSIPYIATLLCGWRHNRSTRDMSIPVLSY